MIFLLHIFILACLTLIPVLGYNIILGKGKILYFGLEAVSLVAVYTLWVIVTQMGMPFMVAFFFAVCSTMLISLLLAWLSLRLDEDAFGVMSIAIHLMALAIVLNWQSVTRGALGIPRIPRLLLPESIEGFAIITGIVTCLWVLSVWLLDRSRFGRQLEALSEHRWHAQSLGIHRTHIHIIAFLVAGAGSIISNSLFPSYIHLVSPTDYNFPSLIFLVMALIAGGPGSVKGCVIATFLLMFLKEGIRFVALPPDMIGPVRLILFGLILLGAVWFRRDTLFPPQRSI